MLCTDREHPRHYPRDPSRFAFDDEVALIFDDMAERSIPIYHEARRLCVLLASQFVHRRWCSGQAKVRVLDAGASTGAFSRDLLELFKGAAQPSDLEIVAVDHSQPMVHSMRERLAPAIDVRLGDVTTLDCVDGDFDVVNLAYVAQFVPRMLRPLLWETLYARMHPGGLLLVSGKEEPHPLVGGFFASEYLKFRRANGYTHEEIQAKTEALKGSMWVDPHHEEAQGLFEAGFHGCQPVSRWLQFYTTAYLR